jgi:hypothetical protein
LATVVVAPVMRMYADTRMAVEHYRAAIERGRGAATEVMDLRADLERIRTRSAATTGFLRSANDSLAAAELQNRLRGAIGAAHGELKSVQVLPVKAEGHFRRVTVRAQLTADHAELQRLVYDLEAGTPYLLIDNVDIRLRPPPRGKEGDEPLLDVRFELAGYLRSQS